MAALLVPRAHNAHEPTRLFVALAFSGDAVPSRRSQFKEPLSTYPSHPTLSISTTGRTLRARSKFAALAPHAFQIRLPLMSRVPVVRPLFPSNIQFLHEEAALCQLQSCFRGELSIMAPTVRHNFPVRRQQRRNPLEL